MNQYGQVCGRQADVELAAHAPGPRFCSVYLSKSVAGSLITEQIYLFFGRTKVFIFNKLIDFRVLHKFDLNSL